MTEPVRTSPRKYAWPKYVLAAFLLFVFLAVLWLLVEVARIKRIKALNAPAQTNAPAAQK